MPFHIGESRRVSVWPVILAGLLLTLPVPDGRAQTTRDLTSPARALIVPPSAEPQTLGPGDQIVIRALHVEEISDHPIRVDASGGIMLAGIGLIHAGGRTTEEVASEIREKLSALVRNPEVSVNLVELHSQPVSVIGAVKTPGVYQIVGQKRVLEILSMAGGLDPDAGDNIRVTRAEGGDGTLNPANSFKVVDLRLSELMEGHRPEFNMVVHANDVITVPRAKLVYVIGQVHRSGGFVLKDRQSMSVLQALSLAEGVLANAGVGRARILRAGEPQGPRQEIPVNIKAILAGKANDLALMPDDVLFIPSSAAKTAALRGAEAALQMGTGIVIWRR